MGNSIAKPDTKLADQISDLQKEIALTKQIRSEKGEKGERGEKGDIGPPSGIKGERGEKGEKGDTFWNENGEFKIEKDIKIKQDIQMLSPKSNWFIFNSKNDKKQLIFGNKFEGDRTVSPENGLVINGTNGVVSANAFSSKELTVGQSSFNNDNNNISGPSVFNGSVSIAGRFITKDQAEFQKKVKFSDDTTFAGKIFTSPGANLCNSTGSVCIDIADIITTKNTYSVEQHTGRGNLSAGNLNTANTAGKVGDWEKWRFVWQG